MASAAWDGSTSKEGKITGLTPHYGGTAATTPGGTTNTVFNGFVAEISGDNGANFVTGIACELGNGTQTVYKKWSDHTTALTGTQYRPALGDILVATSTTVTIYKTQL